MLSYPDVETYSAAVVTVYVRPGGSDVDGDGTLAKPYATYQRASQDAPWIDAGKRFRIDVTGCTFAPTETWLLPPLQGSRIQQGYDYDPYFGIAYQADLEIYAAPIEVGSWLDGQYTASNAAVSGAAGLTNVQVPGAGWTVNEHKGRVLTWFYSDDSPAGFSAIVISNTADTLYVALPSYILAFYSGMTVKLYRQSCVFDETDIFQLLSGQLNYGLTFTGIKFFTPASYISTDYQLQCSRLAIVGCDGYAPYANGANDLVITSSFVRNILLSRANNTSVTYSAAEDLEVCATSTGGTIYFYGFHYTGDDSIGEGFYHGYGQDNGAPRYVSCFYTVHRDTGRGGVRLLGMTQCATIGYVHFDNCGYGAIRLEWQAQLYLNGPISGTGNGANVGGSAVYILDASQLQIASTAEDGTVLDATNCTVTGTVAGADIIVGKNAPISWAQFFATKNANDVQRSGANMFQTGALLYQPAIAPPKTTAEFGALPPQPTGAMYLNTDTTELWIWNGAAWKKATLT